MELKGFLNIEAEQRVLQKKQPFIDTLKKAVKENLTVTGVCKRADSNGNLAIEFPEDENILGYVKWEDVAFFSPAEIKYLNEHIDLYDEKKAKLLNRKCTSRIGMILQLKVKDIKEKNGSTIVRLNRREVVEEEQKKVIEKIEVGNVCKAVVTGVYQHGVFVDIGWDIQGLINIRDICHNFVTDPSKLFKIGQEIDVVVKAIRHDPFQIEFSRLPLMPKWEDIDKYFKKNDIVIGTVGGKINTGVFIKLNETFEGLVNYLPKGFVEGDQIKVMILKIDHAKKRIVLKPIIR